MTTSDYASDPQAIRLSVPAVVRPRAGAGEILLTCPSDDVEPAFRFDARQGDAVWPRARLSGGRP